MSIEQPYSGDETRMWSVEQWATAIRDADKGKELIDFNDVISSRDKEALSPEFTKHLILENIRIGGKTCDVYHWGQEKGSQRPTSTAARVFVHIKD